MTAKQIELFTKYNNRGQAVLLSEFNNWRDPVTGSEIFGPVTAYSWEVNGAEKRIDDLKSKLLIHLLPDASGFICFESDSKPDNCILLDAYGKERIRLTVPWQMTGSTSPESGQPPTCFENISTPYINPTDGKEGQFGVTAWVEYAGKYYFELDYHTGQFLWCKRIMD